MAPPLKLGLARPAIERLGRSVQRAYREFDSDGFVAAALQGLDELELKERVAHVADVLGAHLPDDYPDALAVIVKAPGVA